jgi:hypothetical protein
MFHRIAETVGARFVASLQARPKALLIALTTCLAALLQSSSSAAQNKPNQIRFEYVPPKNTAHQWIHDRMKEGRALEDLQKLLSPIRLPYPLLLKVDSCDGVPNAYYNDEVITVCYELLADIIKNAPEKDLPIGISRADTILGPVLDTFLHETGHAVFRMLEIPVLGREEDAADQFSTYAMLKLDKDEARRMILGAAYQYHLYMPGQNFTLSIKTFADEHSLPAQRMFNILCMAYGADQKLFSDVVERGFLPKERAETCVVEYGDVTFAMTKLIGPHVDKQRAKTVFKEWTRIATARRAKLSTQQKPIEANR